LLTNLLQQNGFWCTFSVLHCVVLCCTVLHCAISINLQWYQLLCCTFSVLQCVAVCCSVLQCAISINLQWYQLLGSLTNLLEQNGFCCTFSVLQCVAVCCSVLQCVAVRFLNQFPMVYIVGIWCAFSNSSRNSIHYMGWLQIVGSLKL